MDKSVIRIGVALLFVSALWGCSPSPIPFHGDDIDKTPAPNFELNTPDGKSLALTDLRGEVVVLTFIYTQCTDICPVIANKLSNVYAKLGNDVNRVKFIAISTAPGTDTPISIARFSQEQGMSGKWTFLTGSRAQLAPVWNEYYIDVDARTTAAQPIVHQSRIIVIDSRGLQRVNYSPDFAPDDLVTDLKTVLIQG